MERLGWATGRRPGKLPEIQQNGQIILLKAPFGQIDLRKYQRVVIDI